MNKSFKFSAFKKLLQTLHTADKLQAVTNALQKHQITVKQARALMGFVE